MIYVGKEYHLTELDSNIISYNDGYFSRWPTHDGENVNINKDVCVDCMTNIINTLNNELENLYTEKHISNIIKRLKKGNKKV